MFSGASNFVNDVDTAFLVIFAISFFFLIGLSAVMIFFVFRYSRKRHPVAIQIKEDMRLEVLWTIVPLAIVLLMFYYGYVAFMPMRNAPKDAMVIKTTASMWSWKFEYANGKIDNELYVPVNKPVKLDLYSTDVIHSLYISAFRIKEDLIPGQPNYMWFIPTAIGTYEILCAEYCGLRHSYMESKVHVLSEKNYLKWLNTKTKESPAQKGLKILKNNACTGCHTIDGSALVGPSFKAIYNTSKTVILDGKEITIQANDDYLKLSILNPDKHVVKGFNKGIMRSYKDVLKDEDINAIIDYLKTLK